MNHQLNVTIISRNKTTTVPLESLPDIQRRVRAVERQYGVQIIACSFQPSAENLLIMKYKKEESGGDQDPADGEEAA